MGNPEGMQVATYISHLPKDSERRGITVMTSDKCKFVLKKFVCTNLFRSRYHCKMRWCNNFISTSWYCKTNLFCKDEEESY